MNDVTFVYKYEANILQKLYFLGIPPPSGYTFLTTTGRPPVTGYISTTSNARTGSTQTRTGSTHIWTGSTQIRTGSTQTRTGSTTEAATSNGDITHILLEYRQIYLLLFT